MSQMDVKSAFLNDPLEEEVYIIHPPIFEKEGRKHLVYRLRKALYGLQQAPRAWNKLIDALLAKLGFVKYTVEFGVYVKRTSHANTLIVCLYVDDLIITRSVEEEIEEFKGRMKIEFEMTDLGTLSYFLGLEFVHTHRGVFLHQKKYAQEILKRFKMEGCNDAAVSVLPGLKLTKEKEAEVVDGTLYKQIVGSLRFLCNSRANLSFGVGLISRFMHDPRTPHMAAAKHILRYLKGTTYWGIFFPKVNEQNEVVLEAFSDSDWCGEKVGRRSTYGYLFKYLDAPISWCSKKQKFVALSSCEAEYIAASEAACQSLWLEVVLEELKLDYRKPVQLNIDNKSAINLSKKSYSTREK